MEEQEAPRRAQRIKASRATRANHICEVLRKINDHAQGDTANDLKIRQLVAVATSMAKRIVYKLYEYNREWDRDFWERNPDYEKQILQDLRGSPDYKVENIDYKNTECYPENKTT